MCTHLEVKELRVNVGTVQELTPGTLKRVALKQRLRLLGVRVGSLLRQEQAQALAASEASSPATSDIDQADLFAQPAVTAEPEPPLAI